MMALIWKEWRENARWGALAMLGMGLALAFVINVANPVDGTGITDKCSAVWGAIYQVMTLFCPLIAVGLGLLQVMPELRRDQWAFLVHRPMTWSAIFWAKAIVGLSLAFAAAGIPFGLSVIWTATPGHVAAPFVPALTLPGVVALLTIVPCYFAGMLTALRPARWYASRTIGLAVAVLAVVITLFVSEFWQAALSTLVLGVILMAAAWGSFQTRGQYEGQPRLGKIGLGITVNLAVALAALMLASMSMSVINTISSQNPQFDNQPYTYYGINSRGRVLLMSHVGSKLVKAYYFDGKSDVGKPINPALVDDSGLTSIFLGSRSKVPQRPQSNLDNSYRNTSRAAILLNTTNTLRLVNWYYVPSQKRAFGYQQKGRRLAGFLGPDGFSPASDVNANRFAYSNPSWIWQNMNMFQFPDAVYVVNSYSSMPSITRLYTAKYDGDIEGAGSLFVGIKDIDFGKPDPGVDFVATSSGFYVYGSASKKNFFVPREHDPSVYAYVNAQMTLDGQHIFFWYSAQHTNGLPSYITEVSPDGIVQNRYTLPSLTDSAPEQEDSSQGLFGLLASPIFVLLITAISHFHFTLSNVGFNDTLYFWTTPSMAAAWRLFIVCSVISGIVGAVFTWFIARRAGLESRHRWLWALGSFFLGLHGALTLLALREWPVLLPCTACGRKRNVDRTACEYCGAGWPVHEPDGTEIFEDTNLEIPMLKGEAAR